MCYMVIIAPSHSNCYGSMNLGVYNLMRYLHISGSVIQHSVIEVFSREFSIPHKILSGGITVVQVVFKMLSLCRADALQFPIHTRVKQSLCVLLMWLILER